MGTLGIVRFRFPMQSSLDDWFEALQRRHLESLEWAEVTRALRALSSAYVQHRGKLASGVALDGRGKRAAFALFYGPLHFATASAVLGELMQAGEKMCESREVHDLGCGTGAAGAAWAIACGGTPRVQGIDIHPWAAGEAAWTYEFFGLRGTARRGDVARSSIAPRAAAVAAYSFNELGDEARRRMLQQAIDARASLLVIEPIARGITPWWDEAAKRVIAAGGRSDDWKLPLDMPERWRLLDRAAGFRRDQLSARTLWIPGR